MKTPASWAVIATMAALSLVCSAMYYRLLRLRRSFDIAARSPILLVFAGLASLLMADIILLHRLLHLEGRGLPCYMTFWPSYTWLALGMTPLSLRAARLVIVYNTHYRVRFARYVKRKTLTRVWALTTIFILAYATLIFENMQHRYARGLYGCLFFNEKLMVEIGFTVTALPISVLLFKLWPIRDVFNIKPEITYALVGSLVGAALQFSLLELVAAGIMSPSHMSLMSDMIMLLIMLNIVYWSSVFPLSHHDRFGKKKIVPSMAGSGRSTSFATLPHTSNRKTCLRFAREGGEEAILFADLCRRSLCMESWDFVIESTHYEERMQVDEQFAALLTIVDRYLKPTSPQEVNISSAMRDAIGALMTMEKFSRLTQEERRYILWQPVHEVCRMLDDNLLAKFVRSPEMQRMCQQKEQEELELKKAKVTLEGDQDMLDLVQLASNPNLAQAPC